MMITNTNKSGTWVAETYPDIIIVYVSDYHGRSNRIGIVHNALNPRDLYLFLNDKENFDYVMQMKKHDVIFLERVYKSNDHIFDVYYIKDKVCMGALLKKYHAEWF